MPAEYSCPTCNETFEEETVEAVILRAAQHNHQHHGGPESLTPELEAALRATVVERLSPSSAPRGPRAPGVRTDDALN